MSKPTPSIEPTTANNLLAAFAALQPMPVIVFEYRVYYEPITRECTIKTVNEQPVGSFITVTREQYDAIEFCPNYIVNIHGGIEKKIVDFTPKKMLKLNKAGQYQTIKDNNIFRVDDAYLGESDAWSIRGFDDY